MRDQPLLEGQAGGVPDRGEGPEHHRDRHRRHQEEGQERRREQEPQRVDEAFPGLRAEEAADHDVAGQHPRCRRRQQVPGPLAGVRDEECLAAHDQPVGDPRGQVDRPQHPGAEEESVHLAGTPHDRAGGARGWSASPVRISSGGQARARRGGEEEAARRQPQEQQAAEPVADDLHRADRDVQRRPAEHERLASGSRSATRATAAPVDIERTSQVSREQGESRGHRQPRNRLGQLDQADGTGHEGQRAPRPHHVGDAEQERRGQQGDERSAEHAQPGEDGGARLGERDRAEGKARRWHRRPCSGTAPRTGPGTQRRRRERDRCASRSACGRSWTDR